MENGYGAKEDFERVFGVQQKNFLDEEEGLGTSIDDLPSENSMNQGIQNRPCCGGKLLSGNQDDSIQRFVVYLAYIGLMAFFLIFPSYHLRKWFSGVSYFV